MRLCMNCMSELGERDRVCPRCGYDENRGKQPSYSIAPGTIIGGRYVIGCSKHYDGRIVEYIGFHAVNSSIVMIEEYLPAEWAVRENGEEQITIFSGEAQEAFGRGKREFLEEADKFKNAGNIQGIFQTYDSMECNDTAYVVREYPNGKSLKEELYDRGCFSYEETERFMQQILRTLQELHRINIIHYELSPENILLTEHGRIKLIRFGASWYKETRDSHSLMIENASGYVGEEMYSSNGEWGTWSDVYAAGAIYCHMLTGRKPRDVMERMQKDDLEKELSTVKNIPKYKRNAILNSMQILQKDRTPTIDAFIAELENRKTKCHKVKAQKEGKWKIAFLGLAATAIVGVAAVVMIQAYWSREKKVNLDASVQNVTMPNVVGKTLEEAEQIILNRMGKKAKVEYQYQLGEKEDTVLNQKPAVGVSVSEQESVTLIMDGGKRYVSIENLKKEPLALMGKTPEQANAILSGQGIQAIPLENFHIDKKGGSYRTIAAIAAPNSVKAGIIDFQDSDIRISLFKGTEKDYMVKLSKEFKGMKYQQDKIAAKAKKQPITNTSKSKAYRGRACGIAFLIKGKSIWDDDVKKGCISYITDSNNNKIVWETEIDVREDKSYKAVLSRGVQPLPKVTGKTEAEAKKILTDAGWKEPKVEYKIVSDRNKAGKVLEMQPKAKIKWKKNKTVTLVIGKAKKIKENSNVGAPNSQKRPGQAINGDKKKEFSIE